METLNTLFVGKVLKELPKLASTNQYALSLLSKSKPIEGTVISTDDQYQGRGQIGSGWESEPRKNITISLILYPTFLPIKNQFLLNQAISLSVMDCIQKFLPGNVKIKWSNDIYIENNKVSGILIQNNLSNSRIYSSIIGIGINVNQTKFITQPPNPTSFKLETWQEFDLQVVRNELCHCLEIRYLQLKAGKIALLQDDYLQNLYRFEKMALYQRLNEDVFYGKIIGIENSGKLKIEDEFGVVESFAVKEIRFL